MFDISFPTAGTRGYKLAEFGLDPHLLRERFAPYTNTFGVEIEDFEGEAGTSALA